MKMQRKQKNMKWINDINFIIIINHSSVFTFHPIESKEQMTFGGPRRDMEHETT